MANIFVAEDDDVQRKLIVRRLAAEGHQVSITENGELALEEIKKEKPDLVILDIMMPGMDGWEVCQKLKSQEETKKLPVIILTARKGTATKEISQSVGANSYLEKPWEVSKLISEVNKLLGLS